MAKADPTRSIQYAIRTLLPCRPTSVGNQRLTRFLGLVLSSLFVVILALCLFSAIGASKDLSIGISLAWMATLCGGAPVVILLGIRERDQARKEIREWESDPRRLAIERFGLDLSAGRMPNGLTVSDILNMDHACSGWRQSRESVEALAWATGDLAKVREQLKRHLDEAMTNLLAEAGAGCPLGPSPFLIERARTLFTEVGIEANTLAKSQAPTLQLLTDSSLEALRVSLHDLREVRQSQADLVETLIEKIRVEGP